MDPHAVHSPEYQVALEEHRLAKSRLEGARDLCVSSALRRPRVSPVVAALLTPAAPMQRLGPLDRLALRLLKGAALRGALKAHDDVTSSLRVHADLCARWLAFRESVLMALESDPSLSDSPQPSAGTDAHEEAA